MEKDDTYVVERVTGRALTKAMGDIVGEKWMRRRGDGGEKEG